MERLTRRQILVAGLAASSTLLMKRDSLSTREINLQNQEWQEKDVENLTSSMLAETSFNDISYAGWILVENLQGRRSLSLASDLFVDDRVQFLVKDLADLGPRFVVAVAGSIAESGPKVPIHLVPKSPDTPEVQVDYSTQLKLESIETDRAFLSTYGDFATKLLISKVVLNARSFDMAANYLANISPYQTPQDPEQKKAFLLFTLNSSHLKSYTDMPAYFMADVWGMFLTFPNYLEGKDQGLIGPKDRKITQTFDGPSQYFIREGVLLRDHAGKYNWTQDSSKFFSTWVEAASRFHALLSGAAPPWDQTF